MNSEELYQLYTVHPSVQMLRLRNAHWVLPFLYQVFKSENLHVIPEDRLIHLLTETLSAHEDGMEDMEEARILFGEDEQTRSRKYLLNWVQKRLLQDFQQPDGTVGYQLSAYTEKVFQWMMSLQLRKHVGTESRFKLLYNSLQDIVEHTEDDRKRRLEMLKDKRAEIDKEIKAIELGMAPENYTNAQVQERLELFTRLCYELISDFREVEDNFKQIHRGIVEQHTRAEQNKGAIVGFAFEAYDALRQSPQGRSFYSFWDFLISRAGNQHWAELTLQLIKLIEEREITADGLFLQSVKSLLLQQGKIVYDANDKMAEKLSRIITEKEITRHRRLRKQIASIKELVFDLMDQDDVDCRINMPMSPEIKMVMDRKITSQPRKSIAVVKQPVAQKEVIADPERFSKIINTSFIDKKRLWQKVELALRNRTTATLKEVLEDDVPENGLAEIVSYYSFLRDKNNRVQIIPRTVELIPLDEDRTRFAEVPYLLFSK
ncbi:MAG: DUF3375 domain-containing protein [Bacteroidetes bacterium]|nr:DUF3375 domain-containing protein [Bacteroidota bacterium]